MNGPLHVVKFYFGAMSGERKIPEKENGPDCFRFSELNLDEDFLAYYFSLIVVQISKVAYHRSENKQNV